MKLLSRVGAWFKLGGVGGGGSVQDPDVNVESRLSTGLDVDGRARVSGRRDPYAALQRLEEGHGRLIEMMQSFQQQLNGRDQRSQEMAEALSTLTEPVARLPERLERQQASLRQVSEQLDVVGDRTGVVQTALTEMAESTDEQRAVLSAIREDFDAARESAGSLASSVEGIRNSIGSLTRAADATSVSLEGLRAAVASSDERLGAMLSEQHRKMKVLVTAAIVSACALGVVTVVSMIVRG